MTRTELALLALQQILNDLPKNKDWLDPEIELLARELVAGRHPQVVWEPLTPARFHDDDETNAKFLKALATDRLYLNNVYQVNVRDMWPHDDTGAEVRDESRKMLHLSIKRLDKEVIHDWRDLQKIKNEIAGPGYEAVEIYPAEERLADSANQYHLWVLPPGESFPFGLGGGRIILETNDVLHSVNRPFDDPALKQEALDTLDRLKRREIPGAELIDNLLKLKRVN